MSKIINFPKVNPKKGHVAILFRNRLVLREYLSKHGMSLDKCYVSSPSQSLAYVRFIDGKRDGAGAYISMLGGDGQYSSLVDRKLYIQRLVGNIGSPPVDTFVDLENVLPEVDEVCGGTSKKTKGIQKPKVRVLTSGRRQFDMNFKRAAVEHGYRVGNFTKAAQAADVHVQQVYYWRRQYDEGRLTPEFAVAFSRQKAGFIRNKSQVGV